jgi:hypothetical protein
LLSSLGLLGGRLVLPGRVVVSFDGFNDVACAKVLTSVEAEFVNVSSLSDVIDSDVVESRVSISSKVDVPKQEK